MLQAEYKPSGWLGTFLSTRLWYGFFGVALESDDAFEGVMDQMSRELARHATPARTPPTSPLRPKSTSGSSIRLSPSRPSTPSFVCSSVVGLLARPTAPPIQLQTTLSSARLPASPHRAYPAALGVQPPSSPARPPSLTPMPDPWSLLGLPPPAVQPRTQPRTQPASHESTTAAAAMMASSLETLPHAMERISKRVLSLETEGKLGDGDVSSWVHDTLANVAQLATLIDTMGNNDEVLSRQITRMFTSAASNNR